MTLDLGWPALVAGLLLTLAALGVVGVVRRRRRDAHDVDVAWRLLEARATSAGLFDPARLAALPEPARRYFGFVVAPGTPLATAVRLTMGGEMMLGDATRPRNLPMRARQILAPPHGLVWQMAAGRGAWRVSGSDALVDGRSWTRFWFSGLWPVARAGGSADHARSAFGRMVAEAAIWAPAALLPGPGVRWEAVDADTVRVTVVHGVLSQAVDIHVDAEGRPLWVRIERWSDANPQRRYRLQPFGGRLADHRQVGGWRLPFDVEGGNFFQTPQYIAFYRARVEAIEFVGPAAPAPVSAAGPDGDAERDAAAHSSASRPNRSVS